MKKYNDGEDQVIFNEVDYHKDDNTGSKEMRDAMLKERTDPKREGESDYSFWCRTFDMRHCKKI